MITRNQGIARYFQIRLFLLLYCFMNSFSHFTCPESNFRPYKCRLLPHSNETLKFPCIVSNQIGCNKFKGQLQPKDLKLKEVHLVSMNLYNISDKYKYFYGSALNFTFSLPNGDTLKSTMAVRVNIWNNVTSSNYGREGICRIFVFNISKLIEKNIPPPSINHNCFTIPPTMNHFIIQFTTLPFVSEIQYVLNINHKLQTILAVAPIHNQLAIRVLLGFPMPFRCKNKFQLTNCGTETKTIEFSTNNSFLFENLEPGFFRVKVESSCLSTGRYTQSEVILLKNISEFQSMVHFVWIFLSFVPFFILVIVIHQFIQRKKKYIDPSHKCVIDLLYKSSVPQDAIVAKELKKLAEVEFNWSINNIPIDSSMICLCEMPQNELAFYLTSPDSQGRVTFPHQYAQILLSSWHQHSSGNNSYNNNNNNNISNEDSNVIYGLLYYTDKEDHPLFDGFEPRFDIVKDIKKLFYFVYDTTKGKSEAELFYETHYPSVNYIQKLEKWKKFIHFIEDVSKLNNTSQNNELSRTYNDEDDDDVSSAL